MIMIEEQFCLMEKKKKYWKSHMKISFKIWSIWIIKNINIYKSWYLRQDQINIRYDNTIVMDHNFHGRSEGAILLEYIENYSMNRTQISDQI